jgi:hypothetical protein
MLIAVRFWGGGVIPEFPRGTGAVAKGLYLRIRRVVPPLRGIALSSAGILWIMYGTGTERSFNEKLCWIGAGKVLVVVIDISIPNLVINFGIVDETKNYVVTNHPEIPASSVVRKNRTT